MNRKIAFVFPGQGSQRVGMGLDFYKEFKEAKEIFDRADDVLGFSLTKLAFEGPQEELQKTINTQPALLATSIAMLTVFENIISINPSMCAGHSLGEFSAYVCAGVFDFETGLRIVRKRGELMEYVGKSSDGAMAAIIGLDDEVIIEICEEVSNAKDSVVVPANFNCPGQIVISGNRKGIAEAQRLAKERKARMVVELKVSGAFHSPLIKDASVEFEKFFEGIEIKEPRFPVIANVCADRVETKEIKQSLVKQLTSPVLWTKSILNMIDNDINTFIEIGSASVLQGLIKKTDRTVEALGVSSTDTFYKVEESLNK